MYLTFGIGFTLLVDVCFLMLFSSSQKGDKKMKMPTKEQIREASKDCPDADSVLRKQFPDAFEDDWEDISKETEWWLREDGVLEIKHDGICRGHYCIGHEFFWVEDGKYKEEVIDRSLRILKRNERYNQTN